MFSLRKAFLILSHSQKKYLLFIFIMVLISMLLESLSIGIILPLFSILLNGDINNNYFSSFFQLTGIEGKELISLRGTLVPATTINRTISSLPLIGDILIGKKVGEGVFGVSFKIKGPPKDLKTTVNPIKTLTPRFITRTLEKIKKN